MYTALEMTSGVAVGYLALCTELLHDGKSLQKEEEEREEGRWCDMGSVQKKDGKDEKERSNSDGQRERGLGVLRGGPQGICIITLCWSYDFLTELLFRCKINTMFCSQNGESVN